ncbi:MAG TPA: YMGG-like glycine zipper-containing protein [Chitinophagaceae bacterium]
MKKIFIISAAALFFAACNTPEKDLETKKDVIITDTTGMYQSNGSTDVTKNEVIAPAKPEVKTITKIIYVDRTPKVKHQTVRQATAVQTQPVTTVPTVNTTPNTNTSNAGTQTNPGEGSAGTQTSTGNNGNNDINTAPTSTPAEKKGWSNAAKDATIGGVGGAVVGAVISKKKGKGAIIGGILGAAGGYILGNKKDKSVKKDLADF